MVAQSFLATREIRDSRGFTICPFKFLDCTIAPLKHLFKRDAVSISRKASHRTDANNSYVSNNRDASNKSDASINRDSSNSRDTLNVRDA
jgi:hypothetical protein